MTEMKIHTDGLEGARRRSLARARMLDKGKKLKPMRSITFESPAEMARMLSEARRKVVNAVREQPMTVTELAKKLKRDPSSVSKDVIAMEQVGILNSQTITNPGHGVIKRVAAAAEKIKLTATL
jgi:predicted transcriptional regulator